MRKGEAWGFFYTSWHYGSRARRCLAWWPTKKEAGEEIARYAGCSPGPIFRVREPITPPKRTGKGRK